MLKSLIKTVLRRAWRAGQPITHMIGRERIHGLDKVHSIHPSALIAVMPETSSSETGVFLGSCVYIGKDTEIVAVGPGRVIVGDGTSFQDRCQIYGDIEIGAHCIFARSVLVISTAHKTMWKPGWLIRDQDEQFQQDMAGTSALAGRKVQIEDDCWIGWGAAVMPGVYIGRGAVIGANAVVTRDVAPYESHGGAPNRKLGERLVFSPPVLLEAQDESCHPYFYRGFRQRQADLKCSLAKGVIEAGDKAAIVLARGLGKAIRLCGTNPGPGYLHLTPSRNGVPGAGLSLAPGPFNIILPAPPAGGPQGDVPTVLRDFTLLELQAAANGLPYGLSSAALQN